jgi:hypothetical protein
VNPTDFGRRSTSVSEQLIVRVSLSADLHVRWIAQRSAVVDSYQLVVGSTPTEPTIAPPELHLCRCDGDIDGPSAPSSASRVHLAGRGLVDRGDEPHLHRVHGRV